MRLKFEGSLARNARFGVPKSQDGRSFLRFAWQAQYFRDVSISACHFCVAGAALCTAAFCICVAGAAFCDVLKVVFHESQCQGCVNVTQCQKSWQAQHFVTALKTCGSLARSNDFGGL